MESPRITPADYAALYHILKLNRSKFTISFKTSFCASVSRARVRPLATPPRTIRGRKRRQKRRDLAQPKSNTIRVCYIAVWQSGARNSGAFSTARKRWPVSTGRSFAPRKVSEPRPQCANVVCNCKTELEIGRCDEDVEVLAEIFG